MTACIGEPISWLRLERFALGAPDAAIASHLAACPACRQCLDQVRGDTVVLPPLVMPVRSPRWTWRRWWIPAFAAAAAAAVLVIVLLPRPLPEDLGASHVAIKGVGEVTLELVRERAGAIRFGAGTYAPGDRWKVVISCPPGSSGSPVGSMRIDVSVVDGATIDHPLPGARIACGNRVVVPGAFTITGNRANWVCARIAPAPTADDGADAACLMVVPETPRTP